jgi:hypothetical protein
MSPQGKLSLKHPAILREDLRRICDRQSAPTLVAFAHGRMAINSENATSMNLRPAKKAGRSVFGQRSVFCEVVKKSHQPRVSPLELSDSLS